MIRLIGLWLVASAVCVTPLTGLGVLHDAS